MQGNRIAFGTGSPKGDSTLLSNGSVKEGDRIVVGRIMHMGYMAIYINGKLDNEHHAGSKNHLNAS